MKSLQARLLALAEALRSDNPPTHGHLEYQALVLEALAALVTGAGL